MARIRVDGVPYEVEAGQNLLHASLSAGLDLPYFCWHPALGSVGACRQCAVKRYEDEADTRGRIVMACTTAVEEGMRIAIDEPEVAAFRAAIIEWLMVNHPHDCPVCEEGGECHLQDMTVMSGHTRRRYRFSKRTFRNQDLGPFLNHEMNRCITCYRCVRFYTDYAGGRDLQTFAIHDQVYFGRHSDGALESVFSGNLAEVCPTGVFTDRTHSAHYVRKWDQQSAPSVCVHCGHGCNTFPGERAGVLRRIINRYNGAVNGYFLCDRGRFGYGFVNSERRVRRPLHRSTRQAPLTPIGVEEAGERLAALLSGSARPIGIGSPRASLEANFALRALVGPDRFFAGVSAHEARLLEAVVSALQTCGAPTPTLPEVESSDAVLVLGEDLLNTDPRLALALRQAVRQASLRLADRLEIPRWLDAAVRDAAAGERSPLFVAALSATGLDELAEATWRAAPDDLARLGFAVARALDPRLPPVPQPGKELNALAGRIAAALLAADRPLVVGGVSAGCEALIQAAAAVGGALQRAGKSARLALVVPECNSLGLALMGAPPLEAAFEALESLRAEAVVVLENDLYRRAPRAAVDPFLERLRTLVVVDYLAHETASRADLILPAGSFAESDGTLVSSEGRAQRFFQVFVPEGGIQESWRWLDQAMRAAGRAPVPPWESLDEVTAACAAAFPALAAIGEAAPGAGFRIVGRRVPRAPHRFSSRTALRADLSVHEPPPPPDPDAPLAFSMEGHGAGAPASLLTHFWAPGWNSYQAVNKFQIEIGGPLRGGDAGARLIAPSPSTAAAYTVPAAFRAKKGEWLLVPQWRLFGSEELSGFAPAIRERPPPGFLLLNPADAGRLGVGEREEVELEVAGERLRLPVRLDATLPRGLAGLPVGVARTGGIRLPQPVRLRGGV